MFQQFLPNRSWEKAFGCQTDWVDSTVRNAFDGSKTTAVSFLT